MTRAVLAIAMALAATSCEAHPVNFKTTDPQSPLSLERTIALPDVTGRIDHLAFDPQHRHLLVAEHDNGSVDEVDIAEGRVIGRIAGLRDPQGVAYLTAQQEIVVASGDGSVRFYDRNRHETARIDLGDDADDVRIDERNGHVVVGYGSGGLATIDPATHRVIGRIVISGHPEGFQLAGPRVLVNVPDHGAILTGNIDRGAIESSWSTGLHRMNFPMAVEPLGRWFAVAYRLPAALAQIDTVTGKQFNMRASCSDADDIFIDGNHIYVVCGSGHVDVVPTTVGDVERVTTASGARTGLFNAQLHTLFVAAPARGGAAAIWVLNGRHMISAIRP